MNESLQEDITYNNEIYAMIVRKDFTCKGLKFFTPGGFSQQLAYMNHPTGHVIDPHIHNEVKREVSYTQEVLFLRKGILEVVFFNESKEQFTSRLLYAGDVLLLIKGGHGFKVVEECEMFEVKQGPYAGDNDKEKFVFEN